MVLITIVIIVLINFISASNFERYDITADGRYTLKPATKELLTDTEIFSDNLIVKVYFTGDLPPHWKNFRDEITLKLEEYKNLAGSRFSFEFINPFEDQETVDEKMIELRELGLDYIVASDFSGEKADLVKTVPGAVLSYPGSPDVGVEFLKIDLFREVPPDQATREVILELLDQELIDFEYRMTSAIRKAVVRKKPVVAFLEGHGELNSDQTASAKSILQEFYDVTRLDILEVKLDSTVSEVNQVLHALDMIDLLIIAKPQEPFTEIEKFVIDQFAMKGGRIIWSIDMIDDHRDSLYRKGITYGIPFEQDLNLVDQLHRYGVRIEPVLVMENPMNSAPCHLPFLNEPGKEPAILYRIFDWPFYPVVMDYPQPVIVNGKQENSKQHIITKGLFPIKLEYASYIKVLDEKEDDIEKTVILETSDSSAFRRAPVDIFSNLITQPKVLDKQYLPIGVLLEGQFSSIYKNRLKPSGFKDAPNVNIIEQSMPTKMLVFSDGDIFKNDIDTTRPGLYNYVDMGYSVYAAYDQRLQTKLFGNGELLINSVDYLLGSQASIETRFEYVPDDLDRSKIEKNKTKWQFFNIGLPLLIILIFGLVQFFYRRGKYTQ